MPHPGPATVRAGHEGRKPLPLRDVPMSRTMTPELNA